MRVKLLLTFCLIAAMLFFAAGCGKKDDAASDVAADDTASKYTPSGKEGTVTGKISFNGPAPVAQPINMASDAACQKSNANPVAEDIVVKDGGLANVFVYILDGEVTGGKKVGEYSYDLPGASTQLDQSGCQYKPRVIGVMARQKVSISNSDQTTHNVHPMPKYNDEWNQTQSAGQAPIEKTFKMAETLIPVKCNQHPWMKAYIGVLRHPFFAVSAAGGSYTIKGVPAGSYTVVAWHEKFGEKKISVKVDANGTATQDFAFDASSTSNGQSSLRMLPAIEFPMLGRN